MTTHCRFNGNSLGISWQLDGNSLVSQSGIPTGKLHWPIVGKPKPIEANDFHHWANGVLLSGPLSSISLHVYSSNRREILRFDPISFDTCDLTRTSHDPATATMKCYGCLHTSTFITQSSMAPTQTPRQVKTNFTARVDSLHILHRSTSSSNLSFGRGRHLSVIRVISNKQLLVSM